MENGKELLNVECCSFFADLLEKDCDMMRIAAVVVYLICSALQCSSVNTRRKVVYRGQEASLFVPPEYKEGAEGVEDFQLVNWRKLGGMASSLHLDVVGYLHVMTTSFWNSDGKKKIIFVG